MMQAGKATPMSGRRCIFVLIEVANDNSVSGRIHSHHGELAHVRFIRVVKLLHLFALLVEKLGIDTVADKRNQLR